MRILVVEDEPDLQGAIADGLRIDGYAVDIFPPPDFSSIRGFNPPTNSIILADYKA